MRSSRAGSRSSDPTASGSGTARRRDRPALPRMTLESSAEARITEEARRGVAADAAFSALTFLFAVVVLLVLCGIIAALVIGALPALRTFGLGFVLTDI